MASDHLWMWDKNKYGKIRYTQELDKLNKEGVYNKVCRSSMGGIFGVTNDSFMPKRCMKQIFIQEDVKTDRWIMYWNESENELNAMKVWGHKIKER